MGALLPIYSIGHLISAVTQCILFYTVLICRAPGIPATHNLPLSCLQCCTSHDLPYVLVCQVSIVHSASEPDLLGSYLQNICHLQCLRTWSTPLFLSVEHIYCLQHLRTWSSLVLVCGMSFISSALKHDLPLYSPHLSSYSTLEHPSLFVHVVPVYRLFIVLAATWNSVLFCPVLLSLGSTVAPTSAFAH